MKEAYHCSWYSLALHGTVVGRFTSQMAAVLLNLQVGETELYWQSGMYHDIGKILVPSSIRLHTGEYSETERTVMETHARLGAQILRGYNLHPMIVQAAEYHHCRFAGGGYPEPDLKGNGIPLIARMVAVADFFAAWTERRPNRNQISPQKVWEEITKRSGTHFDPQMVEVFEQTLLFREYLAQCA